MDFGPLGGGTDIGCDPNGAGAPASEVVPAAGFPLTYAAGDPFVCRISGLPGESDESCARTPPADAYWALYWSDGTSSQWSYSSSGVAGLEVPAGGSIGWRFQDGGNRENPSAPPTAAKPSPSPQPSSSPSPKPSKPPKSAQPTSTSTPTPSASAPERTGGSSPSAGADPETPAAQSPTGPRGDRPGGDQEKAGERPDKGDKGDKGQRTKDKKLRDAKVEPSPVPSESPSVAALEPASDEPLAEEESSLGLTLAAGAAVLVLGGSAGVIAWRRRG